MLLGVLFMKRFYRQRRILFLLMFMMFCFFLLAFRLFQLQISRSPELALWAVKQRTQSIVLYHGRGDIQDRNGRPLLDSYEEEVIALFPTLFKGYEEVIFRAIPDLTPKKNPLEPFIHEGDMTFFKSLTEPLPGLVPARATLRYGPDFLAPHVTGHVRASDGEGMMGIERYFNEELSGGRLPTLSALVDGRQNLIQGLGYRIWERGYGYSDPENVILTLHYDLQKKVEDIMSGRVKQGAVVVMDPWNGDILAMASRPDFHPGMIEHYLKMDQANFINRACTSFQPGSVFKTVLAAAAFEEELATLFTGYTCDGFIDVSGRSFGCNQLHPSREMSLLHAFSYSCNTAFIRLGQELGAENIHRYARLFGLGEKTGIPLKEDPGYIPSPEEISLPGSLANASIGQGLVETTPLQLARMFSIIANGGKSVEPRLVLSLKDDSGRITRYYPVRSGQQLINQSTANRLKYMLHDVTVNGLGRQAALPGVAVGGKTGTAQSGRRAGGEEILNHWFAGFVPLQNPRVVIVVFAEELGEGTASLVFKEVAGSVLAILD